MENKDVLLMIEAIANEKNISLNDVFLVLEEALAVATRKRQKSNIRVDVDRKTGAFTTYRRYLVVEDGQEIIGEDETPFDESIHIYQSNTDGLAPNDYLEEEIPSVTFGRIAAQTVKQLITQKVREAERNVIVADYENKVGEIVITTVKRVDRGNVYVDLGGVDGMIQKNDLIPNETMHKGERIRAYVKDVKSTPRGAQILLSRSSVGFLIELFKMEVPEVSSHLIELKGGARDPGLRSKLAVRARDKRIDPVGSCIGMRGSRVQAVSNELNGERVDVILWDENPAQFVINAMAPADILSIVMDEEKHTMDLVVEEDQLAQAIGTKGQNIRLASQVTGWRLNVMSQEDLDEKQGKENAKINEKFTAQLGIDESVANVLIDEGFTSLDELDAASDEELLNIEPFDETIVGELRESIQDAVLARALNDDQIVDDLTTIKGVDEALANALVSKNIRSQEDLADLSVEELLDIQAIDEQQAKDIIMVAREPWFK